MMTPEAYINDLTDKALQGMFDNYEVKQSTFFGEPWVYIRATHKGKTVLFDVSVATLKKYGIIGDAVKKEWCRAWGEW